MAGKSASPVWQYFTQSAPGKASCKICNGLVSTGAEDCRRKNTTNVWSHLRCHHFQAYIDAQKQRAAAVSSTADVTQPSQTEIFYSKRKWPSSDARSKKLDTLVTEMIATDNHPFTLVSGIGFQRLVATMEPRYKLKTEKHYRTDILDDVYAKVEKKIKTVIAEDAGPFLSFTTDCWFGDTDALMSLTCHFIDNNWDRKHVVLNVKALSGSHTGEDTSDMFISLLKYWDISHDRVALVLRDSGAKMFNCLNLEETPNLGCSAHTIQLVVHDGINSQRSVLDINAKLKNIAKHFNHSVLAKQNLKKIQKDLGLPQHCIIQSDPTRWNSTLHMMQRMREQKQALDIYAAEYGKIATLTAEQWDTVSNLIDTLEPVEEVTLEMSKSEASISSVIPSIAVLKMMLEVEGPNSRGIKTLRETMLQSLNKKFARMKETKCLVLATLLDPRYKGPVVFTVDTLTKAKQWIKEEHAIVSEQLKTASSEDQGSDSKRRRVEEKELHSSTPSSVLEQMYADILEPRVTLSQVSDGAHHISEQLDQYLREPLIDRQTGQPLEWWKQNASRLHLLAPVAKKFLCPPPSNCQMGNIFDNKMSRLAGEHAEQLCFLHDNLPLLNWEY